MENTNDTLANLEKMRQQLPHGYSAILKRKMKEKHGRDITSAEIRRSLMRKYVKMDVVECALELLEHIEETKSKLSNLK